MTMIIPEISPAVDSKKECPPEIPADAPPPYEVQGPHSTGISQNWNRPKGEPTNFLSVITRNGSIKGTYIIDPSLQMPISPNEEGKNEKREAENLHVHTRDGSVDVDIWLVGSDEPAKIDRKRTILHLGSNDGSITARVSPTGTIRPFFLDIITKDGKVSVLLPRSFHGPLRLKTGDGRCILSDGLLEKSATLGVSDKTSTFFVGDLPSTFDAWEGHECKVETRDGKIMVRYIDEPAPPSAKNRFLRKLLH